DEVHMRELISRALQLDIEDVARSAGYLVSNIPVVGTLAALFPEVALDLEPPPPLRQRRPTVLVVDDEVHMRELISRSLRRRFDVLSAGSVSEAMKVLGGSPVDVVLTDERMPEANGIELLMHVARESPRTLRIMITAFADTDLMLKAINDGHVHRFVVKPFRPVELLSMLEEAIAHRPRLVELPGRGAEWDDITSNRQQRREEDDVTDVGLRAAPANAALPWESLRHLVAPIREDALSCVLMVGMCDQPFAEEARGAIEWVLGSHLQSYWIHTEDRALAVVLPGVAAAGASQIAEELRDALSGEGEVAFALAELAATDDVAVVGRRIEDAALERWRKEHPR
ncbi:MAG TPA: response regulator, partial [Kofleriaceae bacterium]|nr:response regulator [Kofleriaceae bacterium]